MTYSLDIELSDPLEAAIDDIIDEVAEAIENIRKFRFHRVMHTAEIDIDEMLAEYRSVAMVWDIQHIKDQRPELTDTQAWEVLQECHRSWERLNDPMLETIRQVAENLFPRKRTARPTKAGEIIAGYGDGDERENLVDLLTDAMRWCERFGEPFAEFCGTARMHFEEEAKSYQKGG